jgi:hypothetical protein
VQDRSWLKIAYFLLTNLTHAFIGRGKVFRFPSSAQLNQNVSPMRVKWLDVDETSSTIM